MSRLRCTRCDLDFDSPEARCPQCMRKSTVVDREQARSERHAEQTRAAMAGDPAAGASGPVAFVVRWLAGSGLVFALSYVAAAQRGMARAQDWWIWMIAGLLGGLLLAAIWSAVAVIRRDES